MKYGTKAKYISYMAIMLALIVVLSIFEGALCAALLLPPGVKPGLGNIVIMFALFFIGKKQAFCLNVLKGLFALITRGVTAGILSLCGGLLSMCVIILLMLIFKEKISYMLLSIAGAIAHNMGQLVMASIIINSSFALYYFPVLIVSGAVMGSLTGILLKTLMPVLKYPLKEVGK